jgi:hypothetical protein
LSRGVEGGLQATAREYAELGVRRSIAALVPGFVIAQAAITAVAARKPTRFSGGRKRVSLI